MQPRWKHRPEGSNWGDYGPEDRLGRLNELTPERVVAAMREVREGLRFCLSLPLDRPGGNVINPSRLPPVREWTTREDGTPWHEFKTSSVSPGATDVVSDDVAKIWLQYSTQWDSFAHVGALFDADGDGTPEVVYYNGLRDHDVTAAAVAGLQGRGVLFDLRRHFGDGRTAVNLEMLEGIMRAENFDVRAGDFACFNSGYTAKLMEMDGKPDKKVLATFGAVVDGSDPRLQRWVTESGVVAMIADNVAVEASMIGRTEANGPFLPLHELCLVKLGIMLGEFWYFKELAEWLWSKRRNSFLLTAPPLRLPGAVGSPVTPVATV